MRGCIAGLFKLDQKWPGLLSEPSIYRPDAETPGRLETLGSADFHYDMPPVSDPFMAGYHAVTIVGYDEAEFGGQGGYRIVNQWGAGWGDHGFAWISQRFLNTFAFDFHRMTDRIDYQPTGMVHWKVYHSFWGWNNVTVTVGVGPTENPAWSKVMITGLERRELTIDMWYDISDAAAYLPPSWENRWWIRVDDSSMLDTGIMSIAEIETPSSGIESAEPDLPLSGPFQAGSFHAFLPAGDAPSNNYYVNDENYEPGDYCTQPGNDANDGLTPATPKRSVQAVIDLYTLKAGDTVWIDSGQYDLQADIVLTQHEHGAAGNPVRFVGAVARNGDIATLLTRAGAGTTFRLTEGVRHIQLKNLSISGGNTGVSFEGGWYHWSSGDDALELLSLRISGIAGDACRLDEAHGAILQQLQMHDFGGLGLSVFGSTASLDRSVIWGSSDKTCIDASASWAWFAGSTDLAVTNTILRADGTTACCVRLGPWKASISKAQYNDFFTANGACVGILPDATNISADPLFADPSNGDFHLESTAGRWDPNCNNGQGCWVNDSENSPCIDAGEPHGEFFKEPQPNGQRLNMGAHGDTEYASKTPLLRFLRLDSPLSGGIYAGVCPIKWTARWQGWEESDTLRAEYSSGTTYVPVPGAGTLSVWAPSFEWDVSTLSPGSEYRLRLVCNGHEEIVAETEGPFSVVVSRHYYVNDGSRMGDEYCTAVGEKSNDGLTPGTPKASLQALLDAYDLEPGDVVYVDAGTYAGGVTVGSDDGGDASGLVTIRGAGPSTVFEGPSDGTAISLTVAYMALRDLVCQHAVTGVSVKGGSGFIGNNHISGLVIQDNTGTGLLLDLLSSGYLYSGSADVRNCLFLRNGNTGMVSTYFCSTANCTFVDNGVAFKANAQFSGTDVYPNTNIRNSIFCVRGPGACGVQYGTPSSTSDYNAFYVTDGGVLASYAGQPVATLSALQAATGLDSHSMTVDPLFVDAAGGDYHLSSTAGSWHGGTWEADSEDSPCIDAGDPADPVGDEPAPNGNRVNLGAYGGTPEASKSAPGRLIVLTAPNGGENWSGQQLVRWRTMGLGWEAGDTLRLEYMQEPEGDWHAIPGAEVVPYAREAFNWDTTPVLSGRGYRVRATRNNADPSAWDESDGTFVIHNAGLAYYVNDGSRTGDEYCTAVGDVANNGLSRGTPKASLQALLDTYDLEPGDVVYVDGGTYSGGVAVSEADAGSASGRLTIQGAGIKTVFEGPADGTAISLGASYLELRDLVCRNAATGASVSGGSNYISGLIFQISGVVFQDNADTGLHVGALYAGSADIRNCLFLRNGNRGIWQDGHCSVVNCTFVDNKVAFESASSNPYCNIRNSIFYVRGSGACGVVLPPYNDMVLMPGSESDYNSFYVADGGVLANYAWQPVATLSAWWAATGLDRHSFEADPLFVDAAGGDYHLSSTVGSWHGGAWGTDGQDSPCIDAGDSADPVGDEPAPNGNRVNLGAYGGTREASKSAPGRLIVLAAPNGGENWSGQQLVRWRTTGLGWGSGDTLRLEYMREPEGVWHGIPGAEAIPYRAGTFAWNTTAVPSGTGYRVRATCNEYPSAQDGSDGPFVIHNAGLAYYVNDDSRTGDVYCTAVGDAANNGLSKGTPKASLQALLDAYDLEPGDVVYVDAGIYAGGVTVGADDGGDVSRRLTIRGAGPSTVFEGPTDGTTVSLSASYVQLRDLACRGATTGVYVTGGHDTVSGLILMENASAGLNLNTYDGSPLKPVEVRNCLLLDNGIQGIVLGEFSACTVTNCTFSGNKVSFECHSPEQTQVRNCVFDVQGNGAYGLTIIPRDRDVPPAESDYNAFYVTGGGNAAYWRQPQATLSTWQAATGLDTHSLSADPLFVDTAGGDYHLSSTAGSWHEGTWGADGQDSPCIDAGDPADLVGDEPAPNGNRVNLGAYGGTEHASKTPSGRTLTLVSPNGGENWSGVRKVSWLSVGQGWQPSDTLGIEYSADSGANWSPIIGLSSELASLGEAEWNIGTLPSGDHYRVRLSYNPDGVPQDESFADFSVASGGVYYVNDGFDTGDVYCTAPGSVSNNGLTSSTPKDSVQAILDTYALGSGNVIYVDAGTFILNANIVVSADDAGSVAGQMRIVGVKGKTILDRGAPGDTTSACIQVASFVTIQNMTCRNAYTGIDISNSQYCQVLDNTISGCGGYGIYGYAPNDVTIERNVVIHSGSGGAVWLEAGRYYSYYPLLGSIRNNTLVTVGPSGIQIAANPGPNIENNIIQVTGTAAFCITASDINAIQSSNFNDLVALDGANLARQRYVCRSFSRVKRLHAVT